MASLDSGGLIFSQDSLLASRAENGLRGTHLKSNVLYAGHGDI